MKQPKSEKELADLVKDSIGPLAISGGATRGVHTEGVGISTTQMTGIALYEPGALTMVAGSGTAISDIERALEQEGQMLAFEPFDLAGVTGAEGQSTIGGVIASNASGPRRVQAGAARDFLLGVRFVDGTGTIVKNGGRVMKNVTGYDLVKLMAGSYGTLGVLTEVSFKVLPKPEAVAQIKLRGLPDQAAIKALSKALGSPFDVSGAVHLPGCIENGGCTFIRVEGFEKSVAYRAEKLKELWAPFGDAEIADGTGSWAELRRLAPFSEAATGGGGTLWKLGVKPSVAPDVMTKIAARHDVKYLYDWGGGRVWLWSRDADISALHADLQTGAAARGGHATLMHSPLAGIGPRFQPEPAGIARLSAGLRAKFDPRGILNPGVMA